MEIIRSLNDVRPGDIGFTTIGGIVPGFFPVKWGQLWLGESVRIGRRSFDHVLVVTEASRTLPPGTVRHRKSGEYRPGPHPKTRIPDGFDVYKTGVITAPRAVQAMPKGAEEIELTHDKHWNDRTTFFRLPEDWPGQAEEAAEIARLMIGTPYSFLSYGALGAWKHGWKTPRLETWINRRRPEQPFEGAGTYREVTYFRRNGFVRLPAEAICSVLVDQAWTLAGKAVMQNTKPQIVTPGAFGARVMELAVARGGAGLLGSVP